MRIGVIDGQGGGIGAAFDHPGIFRLGMGTKSENTVAAVQALDTELRNLNANLITEAGADRVLTMDLHSPQIQGFFSMPADQLSGVPVLCERLKQDDLSSTVVVAADVGEAKDAGRFAKRLDLPIAFIDKRRTGDDEKAQARALIGDVRGKRCLLVDDEIATGARGG